MFTGLVQEIGKVLSIKEGKNSIQIKIECYDVISDAKIGDSIATNGICLTAIEISKNYFIADCMSETLKRTNLSKLKNGSLVNLEKSLTLDTPLGGHLVTGDVDCVGKIKNIYYDDIAKIIEIEIPQNYMKYIVDKGRVSLDGASLTIMNLTNYSFSVSLIPHSQEKITLSSKKIGDLINVETDLIGKYVERLLNFKENKKEINLKFLIENGF